MKKYYLNTKGMTLLQGVLTVVLFALFIVIRITLNRYHILMYVLFIIFGAVFLITCLWIIPEYFKNTIYYVSSREVVKQSGIFYHSKQLMRANAVQYITQVTTPLSQHTGLNFIVLNALGGKLVMLFLSKADAQEIASIISHTVRTEK